jgi:hypothetical protein
VETAERICQGALGQIDDLDVIDGQSDQLIGKIQERYGVARQEAQKQVDEWNSNVSRGSEAERDRDVEQRRKAS